jgi:hypothetical protein
MQNIFLYSLKNTSLAQFRPQCKLASMEHLNNRLGCEWLLMINHIAELFTTVKSFVELAPV